MIGVEGSPDSPPPSAPASPVRGSPTSRIHTLPAYPAPVVPRACASPCLPADFYSPLIPSASSIPAPLPSQPSDESKEQFNAFASDDFRLPAQYRRPPSSQAALPLVRVRVRATRLGLGFNPNAVTSVPLPCPCSPSTLPLSQARARTARATAGGLGQRAGAGPSLLGAGPRPLVASTCGGPTTQYTRRAPAAAHLTRRKHGPLSRICISPLYMTLAKFNMNEKKTNVDMNENKTHHIRSRTLFL